MKRSTASNLLRSVVVVLVLAVIGISLVWLYGYYECARKDRAAMNCADGITSLPVYLTFIGFHLEQVDTVVLRFSRRGDVGYDGGQALMLCDAKTSSIVDKSHPRLLALYNGCETSVNTEFDIELTFGDGETHYLSDFRTDFHWNQNYFNGYMWLCSLDSFRLDKEWVLNGAANAISFTVTNRDTAAWAYRTAEEVGSRDE